MSDVLYNKDRQITKKYDIIKNSKKWQRKRIML